MLVITENVSIRNNHKIYFPVLQALKLQRTKTFYFKLNAHRFDKWCVHSFALYFATFYHTQETHKHERTLVSNSHVGSKLNYSQPCNIFVISSKKWEKRKRKWELFPTFIQNACILKCLFVYKRSSVIIFFVYFFGTRHV